MRKLRAQISHEDGVDALREAGIDVFFGTARFIGSHSVQVSVGGSVVHAQGAEGSSLSSPGASAAPSPQLPFTLQFKKCCIATGASASVPRIPGLQSVRYLTNTNIFNLTSLPRRFGVIGAGPIGCELAQAFARLGSTVTVLSRGAVLRWVT